MAYTDLHLNVAADKAPCDSSFSIQDTVCATPLPHQLHRMLPAEILAKLRNRAWSLIPDSQRDAFRYHYGAMFWVHHKNRWQQVSFALYNVHADKRYAFAPFKPLPEQNRQPRYSGGVAQARINRMFLGGGGDTHEAVTPTVHITTPSNGAKIMLKQSSQVCQRFIEHTYTANDTLASVTKQYTGQAAPDVIYSYNFDRGVTRRNPPRQGASLRVPNGWDIRVEGSVLNAESLALKWQGASSGTKQLNVPNMPPEQRYFWETQLSLAPGIYTLTADADGVSHQVDIEVCEPPPAWIEIQLSDEDGNPVANQAYLITDAKGEQSSGTTDANGIAKVSSLGEGMCDIQFPELEGWQ